MTSYLVRKSQFSNKLEIENGTQAPIIEGAVTDGAGGYLLSVVIENYVSASSLKVEFYDTNGDCNYYYQYPTHVQTLIASCIPGTPTVRTEGTRTTLEVIAYIGGEIACLRAFTVQPKGDVVACRSFSINRIRNSGRFDRHEKQAKPPRKKALKIACILDEFTWSCLLPEANLVQFKPGDDWESIDSAGFDFLLVESGWRGASGLWEGALGGENTEARQRLESLLTSCKNAGIPSAFWNKEDPVHYEYFKSIAAKFDHIFTTDENVLEQYRNELSVANVHCLPFFIQPEIHNPLSDSKKLINRACFAGTWYGSHHVDRTNAMQKILDAAVPLGLDIYDRMYLDPETDYRFPLRYSQFIRGILSYDELCEAHKHYACFINVNIVTDSPSMCARRVFEVLASSTPVVSNPSLSLKRYFKGGVLVASSQEEATHHFSQLLSDVSYRALQGHLGFRSVMGEHTAAKRLSFVAEKLGMRKLLSKAQHSSVTLLSIANHEADIQAILSLFKKFSMPEVKLLLGTTFSRDVPDATNPRGDVAIVQVSESGFSGYEMLLSMVESRFAFFVSPAVEYGANYVSDKLLCFAYMGGPIAYSHSRFGKRAGDIVCRESVPEHEFTSDYDIDSLVIDLENEYWNTQFQSRDVGWLENATSRLSSNKRIYATDSFNFLKFEEVSSLEALRERSAGFEEQDVFV